ASSESSANMRTPRLICRRLFMQADRCDLPLAPPTTGSSNAARMAITATTTSSSSRVNPFAAQRFVLMLLWTVQTIANHTAELFTKPRKLPAYVDNKPRNAESSRRAVHQDLVAEQAN